MLTENRQFVEGLIIKLLRAVPLSALPDAVIFGSAAITLGGIDLERKVDDLDVFISETTFSQLVKDGQAEEYEKSPGVWALKIPRVAKVELLKTFPGVSHDGVLKRAKSHDSGLCVGSMEDLRTWKRTQGRKKDWADLERMKSS